MSLDRAITRAGKVSHRTGRTHIFFARGVWRCAYQEYDDIATSYCRAANGRSETDRDDLMMLRRQGC